MKNKTSCYLVFTLLLFTLNSCDPLRSGSNYSSLPAFTENAINVVVEIPAGTNQLIRFNPARNQFEKDQFDKIDFLPFPVNQGFIPSTISKEDGEDGNGLKVLLLTESIGSGEIVEAIPVAAMEYIDKEGWPRTQILATPKDSLQRTVQASSYEDLLMQYNGLIGIIESWFLNYQGFNEHNNFVWKDEQFALQKIKEHQIK